MNKYEITAEMLQNVIITLKSMDVRGYDSMGMLVGLVNFFEGILSQPIPQNTEEGSEE